MQTIFEGDYFFVAHVSGRLSHRVKCTQTWLAEFFISTFLSQKYHLDLYQSLFLATVALLGMMNRIAILLAFT